MATGYWWNGYEYEKSEREARRRGRILSRARDPQLRRDAIWFLVAAVTVVPVAALPWLGLAGGVYLAVTPGALGYGIGVLVASLVIAPFAWRILGPRRAGSSARRHQRGWTSVPGNRSRSGPT